MKVEKVSVGLVGLGMVCESHLKAYSAHPDAEVLAVCDLDADRSKEIANKYGIPRSYTSYEQLLKDPEINTVDITTPTILHSPMALAAAIAAVAAGTARQTRVFCRQSATRFRGF